MICPKCGFEQPDGGVDCLRCGVVFARLPPPGAADTARPPATTTGTLYEGAATPGAKGAQGRRGSGGPGVAGGAGRGAVNATPRGTGGSSGAGGSFRGGELGQGPPRARGTLYDGGTATGGGPGAPAAPPGSFPSDPSDRAGDWVSGVAKAAGGWGNEAAVDGAVGTLYGGEMPGGFGGAGGNGGGGGGGGGAGEDPDGAAALGLAMRPAPAAQYGAAGFRRSPAVAFDEVLATTFRIYFANFVPFLLISALVLAPLAGGLLLLLAGTLRLTAPLLGAGFVLVSAIASPLVTGAITYGVAQEMRHRETSIGECLGRGLAALLSVLGIAILQGLAVAGGTLLCIVPGILAAVVLSVAVPAALEEREGVLAALGRSIDLTSGHRWTVFGVLLLLSLLQFGLVLLAGLLGPHPGGNTMATQLPAIAIRIVTIGLQATAAAVLYYRLRGSQEGFGVASLPSTFD